MDYGGKRGKKNVVSEINWYEKNNKNKWHMYLSIGVSNQYILYPLVLRVIVEQIWNHYYNTWIDNIFFSILH